AKSQTIALQEPLAAGPSVEDLQERLVALGYLAAPVDGVFGPLTERAVVAFQTRNRLASDGIVGPATWRALRHPDPCSATDTAERIPEAKYCPPAP
ncbi:MAG TPA: peptidoglycan-binding domain-containing protein, partial [Herpetosiphonaceae bacterium]